MTEKPLRIDKWLWFARLRKSRSLAARLVEAGYVRLNGVRVVDPAKQVRPDDVLTLALEQVVRVVKIRTLTDRRGPAREAIQLYEDLTPEGPPDSRTIN